MGKYTIFFGFDKKCKAFSYKGYHMKPVYIICLGRLCGNDFGLPSICVWQVSSPAYFDRTVYFFALCGRLSDETQCVGCGVLGRGGAM